MNSQPRDHERRIADALEDIESELEELAASNTAFAPRADSALEWLEEYREKTAAD